MGEDWASRMGFSSGAAAVERGGDSESWESRGCVHGVHRLQINSKFLGSGAEGAPDLQ